MNGVAHIGPSIQIKGDVTAQEPLTIAGRVTGTITVTGHALTVSEAAHVDADVKAHTIIVGGRLNGNVVAEERMVIQPTANIAGEVSAPSLSIQDGAVVQGKLDIAGHRRPPALKLAV